MRIRLKKDIVIAAGTVMDTAPIKTERFGRDHVETVIGLTSDNTAVFTLCADITDPGMDEWMEEVE